jgi:hypothetical protein
MPAPNQRPDLVLSHRGCFHLAQDQFTDAITSFIELARLYPDSVSAVNNLALCHLFSGNVSQASSYLESFLVTHPTVGGSRADALRNLVAMYDLTDSSYTKKRALLKVIIQGCGDNFDPDALKIQ